MVGWVVEQDFRRNFLVHIITPLKTCDVKRGKCPGDEVDIIAKKDWELEGTNIQDGADRYMVSSIASIL